MIKKDFQDEMLYADLVLQQSLEYCNLSELSICNRIARLISVYKLCPSDF